MRSSIRRFDQLIAQAARDREIQSGHRVGGVTRACGVDLDRSETPPPFQRPAVQVNVLETR
jgi:hypothetical protein